MPRRKNSNQAQLFQVDNLSNYTSKKRKVINSDFLLDVAPVTENQEKFFNAYDEDKHLVAHGVPGTGKSFIALYKALKDVLEYKSEKDTVYLVRSLVQTRSIGYMPGTESEKQGYFETPYRNMVKYMFQLQSDVEFNMLYDNLKSQKTIEFYNTSFLRGLTFDNCVVIVDEYQNMNFHELDSIITRVGENCKIIFSGDAEQTDLISTNEKNGIHDFMRILQIMPSFDIIEFGVDDIVRSPFLKEYILAKRELSL
jgi:predicted ribonuclease YlaK